MKATGIHVETLGPIIDVFLFDRFRVLSMIDRNPAEAAKKRLLPGWCKR